MEFDPTYRSEVFTLPGNPKMFAHMCGPDPRAQKESVLLVLVHGFPELGYSWRYQWRALSQLGYSVVSPDMRGYGNSWVPTEVEDYGFERVTLDFVHLLERLHRKQAVFIGHDFGGSVVWAMAMHRPESCLGVIGINTPLLLQSLSSSTVPPMQLLKSLDSETCGHFDYQVYFQTKGEDELNADCERTINAYFRSQVSGDRSQDRANMKLGMRTNKCRESGVLATCPKQIPRDALWSQREVDEYARNFKRTGFPLNWYRAWDLNWAWDKRTLPLENLRGIIKFPCLMISAEYDAVLRPEDAAEMQQYFAMKLERVQLQCGHWTMIERKHELNQALVHFLTQTFPNNKSKM